MKKQILSSIILIFFIIGNIFSQKSNLPAQLPWVNGNLPSNSINYNYKVVQGDGDTLSEAQNEAYLKLINELAENTGVVIKRETELITTSETSNLEDNYSQNLNDRTIVTNNNGFKAVFKKIDEYFEQIKEPNGNTIYRTWQLYVSGESANQKIPKIIYSDRYGMSDAGFKSLVVPGWGQFYKKKNGKGLFFLLGTAGSLGGFMYANNKHSYNINRSLETNNLDLKKQYVQKAGEFTTIKNITLGAVVGLWIWNVIDATSTPGATKYAQNKPIKLNIVSDQNSSLALNLKYKF